MKYLRKIDTGECFAFSEPLAERKDMVAWTGPLPFEVEKEKPAEVKAPEEAKGAEEEKDLERREKIVEVIKGLDPETFGKAPGRLPAPKVPVVSELVGFKVSAEEIQEIMKSLS